MYKVGAGKSLVGTGTISVSTATPKLFSRFFDFSEPINCSGRCLMRVMRSGGLTLHILGRSALASGCLKLVVSACRELERSDLQVRQQTKLRDEMNACTVATPGLDKGHVGIHDLFALLGIVLDVGHLFLFPCAAIAAGEF
jgi:hypothetical protein